MLISPIPFTLKNGTSATLRSAEEADIPSMLDYLRKSAGESKFILRYPEECGKYTPEGERELFEELNASPRDAMLVCIIDGRVVGNCHIYWSNKIKTRHRANVAITVLKEYWGQGIGTAMFREMIRISEANEQILQMELEFIEGNTRAQALYEKMGFRIAGVHPNSIRLKDGTLLNEYLMIRKVEH